MEKYVLLRTVVNHHVVYTGGLPGEPIYLYLPVAVRLAKKLKRTIKVLFNGTTVEVRPTDNPIEVGINWGLKHGKETANFRSSRE